MAKSATGGTRGGLRGGLGDIYYQLTKNPNGDVEQLIITWNKEKANPNTSAQAVSRMLIAVLMYAVQMMKSLINHSFQYVPAGVTSVNYFSKINMKMLQNFTENYWDEAHGIWYPEKGTARITMAPFQISEGSAITPKAVSVISYRPYNQRKFLIQLSGTSHRFIELRKALGFGKKDSLNLVIILRGEGGNYNSFRMAKVKLNYAFNDYTEITTSNVAQFFDISGEYAVQLTFNQGQNRIELELDNTWTSPYGTFQDHVAYHAVITSKNVKNKWQFSTSYLLPPPSLPDPWSEGNAPTEVIDTWWPQWDGEDYDDMIHNRH